MSVSTVSSPTCPTSRSARSGDDEGERIAFVGDVEPIDVTEMIAVDLPREGPVADDADASEVVTLDDVGAPHDQAGLREPGRGRCEHEGKAQRPEQRERERSSQPGSRRHGDRATTE